MSPNYRATFLTEEERHEVKARLKEDRTSLADEYHIKYFFAAIKDWKIYVHMLITIGKSPPYPIRTAFLKRLSRYLHPALFHLAFPPYHCQEYGIYEQPVAAYDRPSLRSWLFRYHHWRILR